MSFKYDINKITKSISAGASSAAQKSAELYEIGKLNLSIQAEKRSIKELEEKIGHIIYKNYRDKDTAIGKDNDKIIKLCKKIDELNTNITSLNKKIAKIKNVRICKKCGLEIPGSSSQCPFCEDSQED